jgi:ankyrin repeat protein
VQAAVEGNASVLARVLVKAGEDVGASDLDGMNALHFAACNGDVEMSWHVKTSRS